MEKTGIGINEAWTANVKMPWDVVLEQWVEEIKSLQNVQEKINACFFNTQQHLEEIKIAAARTAQVTNAVIQAALVKSVLGATLEETIEGKLAAQFPAAVTETVTAFTDKMANILGIVQAIAEGKSSMTE